MQKANFCAVPGVVRSEEHDVYELPDDHESSTFALLDALWAARVRRRQAAQTTPEPEETQDPEV
jgi:hypothetical protein